jgi:hypothetical protein
MKICVLEHLAHDHFDFAYRFPIVIVAIVNRVKPITNDERLDFRGNLILPARQNEIVQGVLITINRSWAFR